MEQIYTHKTNSIQKQTSTRNINPKPFSMLVQPQTKLDFLNIFIIRNKGKGPPGRTRGPGMANCPARDNQPLAFNPQYSERCVELCPEFIEGFVKGFTERLAPDPVEGKNQIEYELQTHIKPIFLSQLNFLIMKKQILFLAMFALALIFAGTTKSYAQLNPEEDHLTAVPTFCTTPKLLTCGAGDALHPAPGVSYDYTITSSSAGTVHWFVTDDANIRTTTGTTTNIDKGDGTGDYILSSSSVYNQTGTNSLTVNITWKSFDGVANNVLLVAYNVDANNCTDNIEVYRIEPKYSFTLDIAAIADDGLSGGTVSECVAPIVSATYSGTQLNVDYGTNYVFFAVNAANWQTSWMPDDFAVKTSGTSSVTIEGWAYPDEAATGGAWNAVGTDQVEAAHYTTIVDNGFIGAGGACIIVKVRVDHGTQTENIANETINLTVNGEMLNPQTTAYDGLYPDLDEPASGTDCIDDLTTDNADYVITPRPDINESAPTPFELKAPRD